MNTTSAATPPAAVRRRLTALALSAAGFLLSACASGAGGPSWSFMPPGPTPEATASPAPTDGATPDPNALTFDTVTPPDDQLAFVPNTFSAGPGATINVNYLNDSPLEHNIHFFAGPDQNAPSIGATERVTGPDALRSVTITAPEEPGDYYFHCDVHPVVMAGTLTVTP